MHMQHPTVTAVFSRHLRSVFGIGKQDDMLFLLSLSVFCFCVCTQLNRMIRCRQVSRRLKNNRHHTNGPSPHCFLHMNAAATATALNVRQHAKFLYQPL